MANISQIKLPNNTTYDISAKTVNGHTVATDVPSGAVFTDTNNAVTQTATSTNADYEVLFSGTADNTTQTEGARKNNNLTFNPSTGRLVTTSLGTSGANLTTGLYIKNENVNVAEVRPDYNSNGGCIHLNDTNNQASVEIFSDLNNSGNIWLNKTDASTLSKSRVQISGGNNGAIYLKDSTASNIISLTAINGNIKATSLNGVTIGSSPKFTDTTYESKSASSGGTAVSLCTTGEKYNWNNYNPPSHDFASGTTSSNAIQWFIDTYGKRTMAFGFVITGLGWFECMLTFYSATQGGGIMILNGTARLWVVTYINGTITLTEKT